MEYKRFLRICRSLLVKDCRFIIIIILYIGALLFYILLQKRMEFVLLFISYGVLVLYLIYRWELKNR